MTGMPWISTVLAPLSFFSAYAPPMPPFWPWTNYLRLLGPRFMKTFINLMKRNYRAKPIDEFRDELRIPDYGNPVFEGQHSPALVLALFSEHFAAAQPDWPAQTRITGFAFYDGWHEEDMPLELLQFLDTGPVPIVFTLGSSAVWVARDFFHESIAAAKKLGRRAVLLIGDERNHPGESLPSEIIAVDYAPFESLLKRGCVIVHSWRRWHHIAGTARRHSHIDCAFRLRSVRQCGARGSTRNQPHSLPALLQGRTRG
jgi:UDP:flavonoid glycosyltransferase YjiC (YdhE family)